ncbi:hypothetical protein HV306_17125 [Klebsiella grimontii]|uniref:hypothetical protein n=1 Tax=Klebsiella grimontii TaxID=2058152 RepID=UPI0015E571AC|nr:hypothetical protein [Klebsiella grimontii]MDZ1507206.1 hypothetical protein [Klebsiella pneumoniae]QLO78714.1 hypothetical protein HV306_17125 [Klebsiella grimontii]
MKMSDAEFNQFKEAAEKTFQAELICSLLGDYPHQLADPELSSIVSLIKGLTGDAYVYMNKVIYQQEKAEQ